MEIKVYNQNGKKLKTTVGLSDAVFGIKPNEDLMAQYIRVYRANQRQGTVKTKTRGEVRGGGKKPWRQKGTGRARHGSIRSPIWVGGGTVHGPQPKDWSLKMPKKMRRKALFSALSQKLKKGKILVITKIGLKEVKTKELKEILDRLPTKGKTLIALDKMDQKVILSAQNLPKVKTIQVKDLNTYEVLNAETVVFLKSALKVLEETFLK